MLNLHDSKRMNVRLRLYWYICVSNSSWPVSRLGLSKFRAARWYISRFVSIRKVKFTREENCIILVKKKNTLNGKINQKGQGLSAMKRNMRDELEQSELLGIFSVLILKFDTHYCYDAFYPYTEEIFFKSLSISGFFNSVEWQYDWFSIFIFFLHPSTTRAFNSIVYRGKLASLMIKPGG